MARKRRKLIVRDRKKTALRIAVALVSLIALIGAAVLVVLTSKSCGKRMSLRELGFPAPSLLCGTGDGLLYLAGSELDFISFRDEDENFVKALTGANDPAGLSGSEGVKVVWSKNAVQIVGGSFDMAPEGEIRAIRCGSSHVAVCSRLPAGNEQVNVYTSVGQLLKTFDFPKGALMDFGFSEASGNTLWTMQLVTDSGSPRTTVSTFDLNRMSSTGVITVSGQLVERVFFTSSSVFVVGTESLIRYSSSANREIYRVRLYGYRVADISLAGENPLLMLLPRGVDSAAEAASIRLMSVSQKDVAGETAVTVIIPNGTVGCRLLNGMLSVTSADSVTLYSAKGEKLETKPVPGAVTASQKLDEHHILLERSGDCVLLTVGK